MALRESRIPSDQSATGPVTGRVRIKDVARALDLTKGTVSRALNGYADISETTRQRVRSTARRMGYVPLSHAQAIRTGRARSLGLVWRVDSHDGYRAFLSDFLDGVSRAASAEDWSLTVSTARSDEDERTTIRRLVHERKADGFILPRTTVDDARVHWLRAVQTPFVLYGRLRDGTGCSWFDFRGENAMRAAVQRLAGMGHSRIAFVNGDLRYNYAVLRERGYLAGLSDAGLEPDARLIMDDAMTRDAGARASEALLRLPDPPTAIVFAVDTAALGAYRTAAERGLSIGADLSVIGYDGIPEGQFASPQLSTFSVDSRMAGERLATLLIRQIRGAAPDSLRETVEAEFIARGSDAPPARKGSPHEKATSRAAIVANHRRTK